MSDAGADVAAAIERHKEVLASGRHVLSGLHMRDVQVDGADLAIELEIDDTVTNPTGALQGGLVTSWAAAWPWPASTRTASWSPLTSPSPTSAPSSTVPPTPSATSCAAAAEPW